MPILIDGYNLLHVTGLVGYAGSGLQGSREALLRFLVSAIDAKNLRETTIVFDAAEAPPGLPRIVTHEGMTVRYASEYPDADALIEELIVAHHVPRSLTVVSSDHRIQRAAKRRRAQFIDSDIWFAEAARRRGRARRGDAPMSEETRRPAPSAGEVAYWLAEFGADEQADRDAKPRPKPGKAPEENPFPPGYGEDLLDESP